MTSTSTEYHQALVTRPAVREYSIQLSIRSVHIHRQWHHLTWSHKYDRPAIRSYQYDCCHLTW